jgi:hypothetical protein
MAYLLRFDVNEPQGNIVTNAGKISGNYTEVVTFGPPGSFTSSILWNAGQYIGTDSSTVLASQLGGSVSNPYPWEYGMYAFFQDSGTYVLGADGKATFNYSYDGVTLNAFIDPFGNTTFVPPLSGSEVWTTGGSTAWDDYLIAWGYPAFYGGMPSSGSLDWNLSTCSNVPESGSNCGSFGLTSTFWRTQVGSRFIPSPDFWGVRFSAQIDNFTPSNTQTIYGSMDAVFIPEPAILALFGIGLMGMGLARRHTN